MDERPDRGTAVQKSLTKDPSPLDSALDQNSSVIADIESQLDTLANRLAPISSNNPNPPGTDKAGPKGDSAVVEVLGSQHFKLSNISERLSVITRNLEI